MASVSWDKTIRVWDVFEGKASAEAIHLSDEGQLSTFNRFCSRRCALSSQACLWRMS
jgi:hypothetical protein